MERGPEFRALKEAKDHLEAAKPTEDKFSGPAMVSPCPAPLLLSLLNLYSRSRCDSS